MSDLLHAVKGTALSVAEYFTPVLKQSKFKQTGVLTPDEFVLAGDHLVHHCPTWSWSGAADQAYKRPYLPSDKQYLVTKSVPCYKRCKNIEYCSSDEKIILDNDGDGGWVDTHHSSMTNVNEIVNEMTITDPDTSKSINVTPTIANRGQDYNNDGEDDDGEAEDMDQFLNMVDEEDNAVADIRHAQESMSARQSSQPSTSDSLSKDEGNNIIPTRTYDLNITYDKYYQTPRLWLVGYDENHKPLTMNEMYEDISQDHAKKTVTMETHPHIPTVMASVHPCRHAEVMKKVISTVEDGGRELQLDSNNLRKHIMERLGSISSHSSQASDQNTGRATVKLNVYDMVSMAGLNQYSSPIGFGVFHSGVEVFDCEYAYGGHNLSNTGVFEIAPRDVQALGEDSFKFRETLLIGYTDFDPRDVKEIVESLGYKFRGDKYHLLHQNCNHFTDALTKVLCGQGIPSWVNRLAYVSSSLPFIERWLSKYMPLAPGDPDLSSDVKDDEPNSTPPTPQNTGDSRISALGNLWRSTRSLNNGPSTSRNGNRTSNR